MVYIQHEVWDVSVFHFLCHSEAPNRAIASNISDAKWDIICGVYVCSTFYKIFYFLVLLLQY